MNKALNSRYVIDGVARELTPAAILSSVLEKPAAVEGPSGTIIDESFDPVFGTIDIDPSATDRYLSAVKAAGHLTPVAFAPQCTRARIATSIIDTAWRSGHFRLDDLPLTAKWSFNPARVGDMAAFYASVEAAADYLDTLRLPLRRYVCEEAPFDIRFSTPFSGAPLLVDDTLHPDLQSWVAYVPFDTSDYRLGGSQLALSLGLAGGVAPAVDDPDYLMDCFEVVRELSEDGVLLSAGTVSSGGLLTALDRMCPAGMGADVDISGIIRSCGESNPVRVLFAEVPGAIIQIRDADFDYVDAEFLLQDVAWFPLGHPATGSGHKIQTTSPPGIQGILESLMQNAEGED